MEKRNLTPLRNVLVRYLVVCGGGSIVILLVWWGLFMSLIRNGFLLPPVTGAQVCSEARDYAATATVETFDPNAIDPASPLGQLLEKINHAARELKSCKAAVDYLFIHESELLDSRTIRKGTLLYQKTDKGSKMRLNFDTVKQDDGDEQKKQEQPLIIYYLHLIQLINLLI